jgi:hypothetical protein
MKKLATGALVALLAVAGIGLSAAPSDAGHRHWNHDHSGITFGLSFGSPYYPYYHRPYRVHRYYRTAPRVRYSSGWEAHVAWCYNRYRSYRDWDNTFQPYHGPRRECRSPYFG